MWYKILFKDFDGVVFFGGFSYVDYLRVGVIVVC